MNPSVHPGALEGCDGIDTDCDGALGSPEVDDDADGASECDGDCDDADVAFNVLDLDGDGFTTCGGDCDDGDAHAHPGASELCNGRDDDCDGVIPDDESDDDGDGHDECGDGDCDDADATAYPGAPEICDGVDNNCNGVVPVEELDADGDGYDTCGDGDCDDADADMYPDDRDFDGYSPCGGDCNDGNGAINPLATDVVGDGLDQNCDGLDGVDADGDGWAAEWSGGLDCDDSDPLLNVDDADADGSSTCDGDCDDSDPLLNLQDADGDGTHTCDGDCDDLDADLGLDDLDGDGFTSCDGDCDDLDVTVFPGAPELCDGLDNDCDGVAGGDMVVPTDCATIQEAIDDAPDGAIISVERGTFDENLDFLGKAIEVRGAGLGVTVIDGGGFGSVVTFESGEGPDAILSGVSIVNGRADEGGGVRVSEASPTLEGVMLTQNVAVDHGGGLFVGENASVTLVNSVVSQNFAERGGGVYVRTSGGVDVTQTYLIDNEATYGGGMYSDSGSTALVENAVLAANVAHGGGAVYTSGSSLTLSNATVVGNQALLYGGGIYLTGFSSPIVHNVIVSNNVAIVSGGGFHASGLTSPQQTYTNVWGNSPENFFAISDPTGLDGNLSTDPGLAQVSAVDVIYWDYHLTTGSPAIDAGDPAFLDPDASRSDMGVYGGPGARYFDLDNDGYFGWWQPGDYDFATYPAQGWDCDDKDHETYPGQGC